MSISGLALDIDSAYFGVENRLHSKIHCMAEQGGRDGAV
jgi:hypothetical protein